MSDILETTGYEKMACQDMHHQNKVMLSDTGAGFINLQIVGSDPDVGTVIGTEMTENYSPDTLNKNPDGTFMICIETVGVFDIVLFDGSPFQITAVQAAAYLGQWYPARIYRVNTGTTGDFSVGY